MKKGDAQVRLLIIMFAVAIIVFAIVPLVTAVVAFAMYKDAPITEIPTWAYMFLAGR